MIALHVSAIACSCVSLMCLLLALGSEYWTKDSIYHFGLWNNCTVHTCNSINVEGFSVSYHAIRAFMILGLIAGAVSLGGLCTCLSKISMGTIPSIASFIAGLCVMIAMSIFSAGIGSTKQYGWSFGLAWASFPLYLLTEYDVFVIGFLGSAAAYSASLPIALLLLYLCKNNSFLSKRFKQTYLLPALTTMIGMSVYTGHYTYEVNSEERGFSFWMAWASFPISLVAAFAGMCHIICQEIEEENEIIENVIPGN